MLIDEYMQMLREDAELYDEGEALNKLADQFKGEEQYKKYKDSILKRKQDEKMKKGMLDYKKYKSDVIARNAGLKAPKKHMSLGKKAAIGAGAAAAAGAVAGGAALALKKHRAKKAAEVAVEEGCTLEEALQFVLECEQSLLDEGYDFEDIYAEDVYYDEDVYEEATDEEMKKGMLAYKKYKSDVIARNAGLKAPKKHMSLGKKAAIGAGAAAAAGGAALALKKHRAKKAAEVAVEEGCTLEEAYDIVIEAEQMLLDEGYDFSEIYE